MDTCRHCAQCIQVIVGRLSEELLIVVRPLQEEFINVFTEHKVKAAIEILAYACEISDIGDSRVAILSGDEVPERMPRNLRMIDRQVFEVKLSLALIVFRKMSLSLKAPWLPYKLYETILVPSRQI